MNDEKEKKRNGKKKIFINAFTLIRARSMSRTSMPGTFMSCPFSACQFIPSA